MFARALILVVHCTEEIHEHDHHRFFSEHFVKKGSEVARACLRTVTALRTLGAAGTAH